MQSAAMQRCRCAEMQRCRGLVEIPGQTCRGTMCRFLPGRVQGRRVKGAVVTGPEAGMAECGEDTKVRL